MRLIRRIVLGIALSPYTQVARFAAALLSCLIILDVINMTKIDVITYGIPEDYMPYMLVLALVAGLVGALFIRYKLHDMAETHKHDKGKLDKDKALPYDKKYERATFIGLILGVGIAMFATPAVVNELFINAGTWTYAGTAAFCALVLVPIITTVCHLGVRVTMELLSKTVVDAVSSVKDAADEIDKAIDDLKENPDKGSDDKADQMPR